MAQKKLEPHADLIEERYYKKLESFKAISEALRELGCDVTPQGVSAYLRRRERKRAERLQRLATREGLPPNIHLHLTDEPTELPGTGAYLLPAVLTRRHAAHLEIIGLRRAGIVATG